MSEKSKDCEKVTCSNCADANDLEFDFSMAFQPIINCKTNLIYGYEALVRGLNGESAYSIISKVNEGNRYAFDQLCRIKAIQLASKLGITSMLSINFLPNAIYKPERCIRTTLEAAKKYNFPIQNIMFVQNISIKMTFKISKQTLLILEMQLQAHLDKKILMKQKKFL